MLTPSRREIVQDCISHVAVEAALSDLAFALQCDEAELARMHLADLVDVLRKDGYQIERARVAA